MPAMHAQDAVVLARALRGAMQQHGASPGASLRTLPREAVARALRGFERERTARKLKISVRSYLMGAALQIPFRPVRAHATLVSCVRLSAESSTCPHLAACPAPQVVAARNYAVSRFLPVRDFLDHASYDCGTL